MYVIVNIVLMLEHILTRYVFKLAYKVIYKLT